MFEEERRYCLSDLVMITGLTDRTLRNYLSAGVLHGTKEDGQWRFTSKEVESFLDKPGIRSNMKTKNQSVVFDFLSNSYKNEDSACLIIDLPKADGQKISSHLCKKITETELRNFEFRFEETNHVSRFILKGRKADVLRLAAEL